MSVAARMMKSIGPLLEKVASEHPSSRAIVNFSKSFEGVESINKQVVEKHFDIAFALGREFLFRMPPASLFIDALLASASHVVPVQHEVARRAWAKCECTKLRMLVAHTTRLCQRAEYSNSVKINMIKTLW